MKTTKYFFMTLLMAILSMNTMAQGGNVLSIPDVTAQAGMEALIPIMLDNEGDVVAMEFDIMLPEGFTVASNAVFSNRCEDHIAIVQGMGEQTFKAMLYSTSNKPLRGNSGEVMALRVNVPEGLMTGTNYAMALQNAVLVGVDGGNILSSTSVGVIRIGGSPDLVVKSVTPDKSGVSPGEKLVVSWQVENIGETATGDGWTEQVSLVDENGEASKMLASTYCDQRLVPGAVVSRSADILLPQLIGIDGQLRVQVRIVPSDQTGEDDNALANNIAISEEMVQVAKMLFVQIQPTHVTEGESQEATLMISRSGSWANEETFNISHTNDSRVQVPATVSIPSGQSGEWVQVAIADNDVLDNDSIVTLTISGNGYEAAAAKLVVEDDELPALKLTASKSVVAEGETISLTISSQRVSSFPVEISLTTEDAKRMPVPASVTIPAGEEKVIVNLTAYDDDVPSVDVSIALAVSALGYESAETVIVLTDDDMPILEMSFSPDKVSEGDGPVSVIGTLRRNNHKDSKITIKLTDDSNGMLFFGTNTLEMSKGEDTVNFQFGPIDNDIHEGDRTYNVTAAVYVSSCDCEAKGEAAGNVTVPLQVFDNDGAALVMTAGTSTIREGDKTTLTITRNTMNDGNLIVELSSDYDEFLEYEHHIVIPAGEKDVEIEVISKANHSADAKEIVVFVAKAEGFSQATCWVMMTDQTKPDARITHLAFTPDELDAGGEMSAKVTIVNKGNAPLPALTCVKIYAKDVEGVLARMYVQEDLMAEDSITMVKNMSIPNIVGDISLFAVVNEDHDVSELSYVNNTSELVVVKSLPTFTAFVQTDKNLYKRGEKVLIRGNITGSNPLNTEVEVYVVNNGIRETIKATADEGGNFVVEYSPYEQQVGHFFVGACYPGENAMVEQATFDVAGFMLANDDYIMEKIAVNETTNTSFLLNNPCSIPMTGVNIMAIDIDDDCLVEFEYDDTMQSGQTSEIILKMTGKKPSEGNQYKTFAIKVTSNEGAEMKKTVYYYTFPQESKLVASETSVNTTITKGQTREYPIVITNRGKGETGTINVLLPQGAKWISLASNQKMESLATGDSALVLLRFASVEQMQLNVPISAIIALNCDSGDGMQIPITLEPVSEDKGIVCVDVCDEYTYYTEEKPHLAGASVKITHPTLGTLLAEGVTDANGLFEIDLNEGYYTINVTAEKHDQYRGNILVDPGRVTNKVVNLSIQGVSITWDVVETEVEDQYRIVTNVTYETNVPAPVVVLKGPEKVDGDSMEPGETMLLDFTLTNYGLVKAVDVTFMVPEPSSEWLFTPLAYTEPFDLAAMQTVHIPVLLKKLNGSDASQKSKVKKAYVPYLSPCMAGFEALYGSICGTELKENKALWRLALKTCGWSVLFQALSDALWKGGPNIGIGLGGFGPGIDEFPWVYVKEEDTFCNPDAAKRMTDPINFFEPFYFGPLSGPINDAINISINSAESGGDSLPGDLLNYFGGKMVDAGTSISGPAAEAAWSAASTTIGLAQNAMESHTAKVKKITYDWMWLYDEKLIMMARQIEAWQSVFLEFFGDPAWLGHFDTQTAEFYLMLSNMLQDELEVDVEQLRNVKPDYVTMEKVHKLVERMENTQKGLDVENSIHIENVVNNCNIYKEMDVKANDDGYPTMADMFYNANIEYKANLDKVSHSMCASVTLQFDQNLVLTRQAFRGTLSVYNGHDDTPMTNVKLHLVVKDAEGCLATSKEFQINLESLERFTGNPSLGSEWELNAKETGKASILFIPTKYAAQLVEKTYSFGGLLEYVDPFTGLVVTRDLLPVTLTVKPTPEFDLAYFMQRDVFGDNPFTKEVEKSEPAEFALIINNKGYGDANNVRMVTSQPQIVDNKKGLLIDFELISSQVNGGDASLALGQSIANDFGTIEAHSQAYAQWWLQSSLLGHFIDYDVKATHVTSYGNENLSLLDSVAIHELIHGFTVEGGRGFLVNDIPDMNDLPDRVYFTDATIDGVAMARDAGVTQQGASEFLLSVASSKTGWNYGSLSDPTSGKQKLVGVTRQSDGASLPLDNVWQTSFTMPDGADPIAENLLHFVVNITGSESYLLAFEPLPDVELIIDTIIGIPADGEVSTEPLSNVIVRFNKPIMADSFNSEDVKLVCQGINLDAQVITITPVSDTDYSIDLSSLTTNDGFYVLTIQTSGITDKEGFNGLSGKTVSWIQLLTEPLTKPNCLYGTVTTLSDGAPVEGAVVTLCHNDVTFTTISDAQGRYEVRVDDTTLEYEVTCVADGFIHVKLEEVVVNEDGSSYNFLLARGATVLLPSDGVCTFSSTAALDFSQLTDKVKAYYGKRYNNQSVSMEDVAMTAPGEGLVLIGQPGLSLDIPEAEGDVMPLVDNLLTGTAYAPYMVTSDNVYVLSAKTGKNKFHRAAQGLVIPRYKAYLVMGASDTAYGVVEMVIDEATLVHLLKGEVENENHFGINGMLIERNSKGVHVLKGKKILVK